MNLQEAIEFLNNQGYYLKEARKKPIAELSDEELEEIGAL
jgi:hypothetical protein